MSTLDILYSKRRREVDECGRMDRSSEHHQRNFYSRHHLHKDLRTGSDSIIPVLKLKTTADPVIGPGTTTIDSGGGLSKVDINCELRDIIVEPCSLRFSLRGLLCPPFNSFKFL